MIFIEPLWDRDRKMRRARVHPTRERRFSSRGLAEEPALQEEGG
jgi:hypothetical protein